MSMGPGWYEDQYVKTLGKLADGPINFGPSYDPQKALAKQLIASLAKAYPGVSPAANHVYTFEALLVAADAYKRAGSTDPKALADAIRTTNITDNVGIGAGIQFNERGQNDKIKCAATQIQDGRTGDDRANGDRQRQADVADGALRQARLKRMRAVNCGLRCALLQISKTGSRLTRAQAVMSAGSRRPTARTISVPTMRMAGEL